MASAPKRGPEADAVGAKHARTELTLMIDNYDSFTYNLAQYIEEIGTGGRLVVVRNDAISVEECVKMQPTRIVISPGAVACRRQRCDPVVA
jgi:anthranilate/para-aminobenzoate synthase component II